jgi:hypothetical protein
LITTNPDSVCALIKKNVIYNAWSSDEIDIEFPNNAAPDYVRLESFSISLIDGVVESIRFRHNGPGWQVSALHALDEKFGKPSRLQRETVQNGFDAKFSRVNATWNRPWGKCG